MDNMKLYIASMIKELESLAKNYIGADIENAAYEKLITLLRETYIESPMLFSKHQTAKINNAKKTIERKKHTYGTLPLKAGYYYADRNEEYKILSINDESGEFKYNNGRVERLTGNPLNGKKVIFRNMLMDRENDPLLTKLVNSDCTYEQIYEQAKKPARVSHCYECKATVNSSCSVCYLCGWFICKFDGACGCHFSKDW